MKIQSYFNLVNFDVLMEKWFFLFFIMLLHLQVCNY